MIRKSNLSVLVLALSIAGLVACATPEQKACTADGAAAATAWQAAAAALPGAKAAATDAITAAGTAADSALTSAQAALTAASAGDEAANAGLTAVTEKIKTACKADATCVQKAIEAATALSKGEAAVGVDANVTEASGFIATLAAGSEAKTKAQADVDAATAAKATADARKAAIDGLDAQIGEVGAAATAGDWTTVGAKATALVETLGDAAPADLTAAIEAIGKAKTSCDAVPK